jgi:hypothetical protein
MLGVGSKGVWLPRAMDVPVIYRPQEEMEEIGMPAEKMYFGKTD